MVCGLNPRIEEYLADVAEPTRPQLLQELIALEVAYRRKDGETPAWADYESRFPSDKATVRAGFAWGSSIEVTSARPRTDSPSQHARPRRQWVATTRRIVLRQGVLKSSGSMPAADWARSLWPRTANSTARSR